MPAISTSISRVLELLYARRDDAPDWVGAVRAELDAIADEIRPHIPQGSIVKASAGFGSPARVPWVAILGEGGSGQQGYYPVLLFAADGSRAYASLTQGTLEVPVREIKTRTATLRQRVGPRSEPWITDIDLRTDRSLPRKYELANVYAVPLEKGDVPSDESVLATLQELMELTTQLKDAGIDFAGSPDEETSKVWIFQSKPELYDLESALLELHELTWLVNQHRGDIATGDKVYLWESGDLAGIVAVGTVLTDPAEIEELPDENSFWRDNAGPAGTQWRVRLSVDQIVEPRVLRADLKDDPVLSGLEIMRRATGTNFPVTAEQDQALQRRMAGDVAGRSQRRALKVAPGRDGAYWGECLANGYICVGWEGVGDLRAFTTRDEFLRRFAEVYPQDATGDATGLWRLRELDPGDIVVANRGTDHILGVGTVVAPGYEWEPERARYNHIVRVAWNTDLARDIEPQSAWRWTIRRISPDLLHRLLPELVERAARRYFVAISSPLYPDAWERAKELGQWGATKVEKAVGAISPGDKLLIWLGRKGFAGVAEAASSVHEVVETPDNSWHHGDQTYPFRVDLTAIRDFPVRLYPPFPKGQNAEYGLKALQFAGHAMIEIKRWQYERIMAELARLNPGADPESPSLSLPQLAALLCLTEDYLRDVDWLLRDNRQLVFYGPPGTGKTFVAETFAEWFAGSKDRVETIQFHPSYAYEDFVEGIRPELDVADLRYRLAPGLLKRLAERARKDPTRDYVLVIDEINRANLARVFGELLYLLEYRNRAVTLPYSGERFTLPNNLYLIGTMNTADRSIALVDFALRRRFHFIEFKADPQILRRWLKRKRPGMVGVADLLAWVNGQIDDHDFAIGFSYFMRDNLDDELLKRIWERSLLPALDEFYFDNQAKRARFGLESVRKAVIAEAAGQEAILEDEAMDAEFIPPVEPETK